MVLLKKFKCLEVEVFDVINVNIIDDKITI